MIQATAVVLGARSGCQFGWRSDRVLRSPAPPYNTTFPAESEPSPAPVRYHQGAYKTSDAERRSTLTVTLYKTERTYKD